MGVTSVGIPMAPIVDPGGFCGVYPGTRHDPPAQPPRGRGSLLPPVGDRNAAMPCHMTVGAVVLGLRTCETAPTRRPGPFASLPGSEGTDAVGRGRWVHVPLML